MRICHVVDSLTWTGGVQEYVAHLARAQVALGHDVTMLCTGDPARHVDQLNPAARDLNLVWHRTTKVFGHLNVPRGMMRSIRRHAKQADIVHVHQAFFAGTWMTLLSRARVAATCYLHPADLRRGRRHLRRGLLRFLSWRADLVVGVSQAEVDLLSTVRRPRRTCVIWPGLDTIPRSNQPRRPLVLSVGRLSTDKGIDTLVPACAAVVDSIPVAIVGLNVDPQRVDRLVAASGLPEGALRGSLADSALDELYATATIFVSTSQQESFGIAALKAIAGGCRPLLSDIPSHREIITTLGFDERCLFPVDLSPEELAERILAAAAQGPTAAVPRHLLPTWESGARAVVEHYGAALRGRVE